MYRCILLDIDGTIIDTEKAVICSLQKLLKKHKNREYSSDELSFALGIPGVISLHKLEIQDVETASQEWNEYLKYYAHYILIFPQIEDTLKDLAALKIQLGIVTSKTRVELLNDFYPFGLHLYFNHIICADDTLKHKPDPEPILKFLDVSNVRPSETIYIGDTNYDSLCAHAAGVDFALALWGTKDPLINAKIKLNAPGEILQIINTFQ